jgi:uncharacterized phage protein (TIGR01671 family)
MKKLKFRMLAQTTDKIFGYVYIYDLLRKGADVLPDYEEATLKGVKFEQYTGLKDKNGKEIYEGDIVEEKINTGDYDVDGTYRYKVVWDDDMLCWSLNPNSTSIHKDLWECNHSLKVVGNIHENPELVGGEK